MRPKQIATQSGNLPHPAGEPGERAHHHHFAKRRAAHLAHGDLQGTDGAALGGFGCDFTINITGRIAGVTGIDWITEDNNSVVRIPSQSPGPNYTLSCARNLPFSKTQGEAASGDALAGFSVCPNPGAGLFQLAVAESFSGRAMKYATRSARCWRMHMLIFSRASRL